MILKAVTCACLLLANTICFAQPNCNVYKWKGDALCYKACLQSLAAIEYDQGSAASQNHFDTAIALCPAIDYAYYEKSVPYLKRADFITWNKLMDKAIALNPAYLSERGWCRYKFLRDYEGAISDIDKFGSQFTYDIGYSGDGDYHMNILKALCYKGLGQRDKAIELIEKQLTVKGYTPRQYDYLHLGVLKLEINDMPGAIDALTKEIEIADYLADTYYYLSIAYGRMNNKAECEKNIIKAKEYYMTGKKMTDPYTDHMDKVYLSDIENEMRQVSY